MPIMRAYKLTLPSSDNVIQGFEDCVSPLIKRIVRNVLESRSLTETRDLLLPKLISGEIRAVDEEAS
jgi:type I restriction enzyme S subunit